MLARSMMMHNHDLAVASLMLRDSHGLEKARSMLVCRDDIVTAGSMMMYSHDQAMVFPMLVISNHIPAMVYSKC